MDTLSKTKDIIHTIPYWLLEGHIEPEKKKIVLFLKKGETFSNGIKTLGNYLGRMPTDDEIISYFK